jgi:hypothetical protein
MSIISSNLGSDRDARGSQRQRHASAGSFVHAADGLQRL